MGVLEVVAVLEAVTEDAIHACVAVKDDTCDQEQVPKSAMLEHRGRITVYRTTHDQQGDAFVWNKS